MTATTALEQVSAGAIALARKRNVSLHELADALDPVPEPSDDVAVAFPKLPKPTELTPPAKLALTRVNLVFGMTRIHDRRTLSLPEMEKLSDEADVLNVLAKVLKDRLEEIKETVRVHMDVEAEKAGIAVPKGKKATQRDRRGHYLLATPGVAWEMILKGFSKGWSQTFTSGSVKTEPTPEQVQALLDSGAITREEYLAVTRSTRTFDPLRLSSFIRRHPERGLGILKALTTREDPNSALHLPER